MYKIKNWDKFQHYKPKNAKHQQKMTWYKMYGADILNDHVYMKLSTTEKLFLREAWDLASQFDGTLPDIENCAFRLRQSENDLKKAYDNLSAKGFLLSSDGIEKVYTPSITIQASAEVIKNPSKLFEEWWVAFQSAFRRCKAERIFAVGSTSMARANSRTACRGCRSYDPVCIQRILIARRRRVPDGLCQHIDG